MDQKYVIPEIGSALQQRKFPTVLTWNRLEGRPRTHNFDRSLKAEVRDALWMLTRQWQVGEFRADDAGSPFLAKLHISITEVDRYRARPGEGDGGVQEYGEHIPLEVRAEQKRIPFTREGSEISLDIRLQMGRQWSRMLEKSGKGNYIKKFLAGYPFRLPERDRDHDHLFAHREVWQQYAAISGRCIDGYKVYRFLEGSSVADDSGLAVDPADVADIDTLGEEFRRWYRNLYSQPAGEADDAWVPEKLEYRFECIAREGEIDKVLKAESYHSGHLDWYAFDLESRTPPAGGAGDAGDNGDGGDTGDNGDGGDNGRQKSFTDTFIPSHVEFDGMPETRWWQFEDSKTDLGDIKPSTTDLAKLLLVQFGLIYANDWFMVPFELPTGSLARVKGLAVTNNFGERFWIGPAGRGADDWQRWGMFRLHGITAGDSRDNLLFLAPAAPKVQEGLPLEEVRLIRDEMANMVWGVESIVPLATGFGRSGHEAAGEVLSYHKSFVEAQAVADYKASVYYLAMTTIPENWIPLVPVHKPGDNREVQLQRSAMLRLIQGDPLDPPAKIRPRTSLLREGLDPRAGLDPHDDEAPQVRQPYYLHEEEVPRAGAWVRQHYQRTRWTDGEVFVWLGVRKKTGKGEGSSNLAFDQVIDAV